MHKPQLLNASEEDGGECGWEVEVVSVGGR